MADVATSYSVLLVDDDPQFAASVSLYMQGKGLNVDVERDGQAAWNRFQRSPPDAVVADVMLPGVDGLELLARIRSHPSQAQTPVILLSTTMDALRVLPQLQAADAAFDKPLLLKELIERLDVIVEQRCGKRRVPPSGTTSASLAMVTTGTAPPTSGSDPRLPPIMAAASLPALGTTPPIAATLGPVVIPAVSAPAEWGAPAPIVEEVTPPGGNHVPPAARAQPFGTPTTGPGGTADPNRFQPVYPTGGRVTMTRMEAVVPPHGEAVLPGTDATSPVDRFEDKTPVPGALTSRGNASLERLSAVVVQAFEKSVTGILELQQAGGKRQLLFHEGLIVAANTTLRHEHLSAQLQAEGFFSGEKAALVSRAMDSAHARFGEAAFSVLGLSHSFIVESIEKQIGNVARSLLCANDGTFELRPWTGRPGLSSNVRLDPIQIIHSTCLQVATDEQVAAAIKPLKDLTVLRSDAFNERFVVFRGLRHDSPIVGMVQDRPSVDLVLERLRSVGIGDGERQLLALILSQTLLVGDADASRWKSLRTAVVGAGNAEWRPIGVPYATIAIRERIAAEWVRTGGRSAYDVLSVPRTATEREISQAREVHVAEFGPPCWDDANLGPAKTYLAIVRARRDEAARILLDPAARDRYDKE